MNWGAVARSLEAAAGKKQDEANMDPDKAVRRHKDETASLLRILASAIKFGLASC